MVSHSFLRELAKMEWKVPKHIALCDIIAVGSFGVVAKASTSQGKQVCIKRSLNLKAVEVAKAFWIELILLKNCNHPNVIKLIDSNYDSLNRSLTFVMPRASCDLQRFMKRNHPQPTLYNLFVDILYGLQYLHSGGVVHRDLAPSNIFIFKTSSGFRASIGDLGMACFAYSPEQTHQLFTTFPYRAPELFCRQGTTNPAVDVWSAGCILAEIVQKTSLFHYPNEHFSVNDEWWIFGRQCCALIPKEEMFLYKQSWIESSVGRALFSEIQKRFVQHQGLLWACPEKYNGVEDTILRKILVIDPNKRPNIHEVLSFLDLEVFQQSPIPNVNRASLISQKKLNLNDILLMLDEETQN